MREHVTADIIQTAKFEYGLVVRQDATPYISQPMEAKMTPVFNNEHHSFIWVWFDEATGNPMYSWSLKFLENEEAWKAKFGACIYESMHQESFYKVKKDEQDYVISAYQDDVDMEDAFEEQEETLDDEPEHARNVVQDESDDEAKEALGKSKNSQLAVGYKHERSFVVRGDKIGVFKHTDDDRLKFSTAITNIKALDGHSFSPRKVMLHEQDSSMVLMNPNDAHKLYKMDLEYGKVVEEWKVDDVLTVDDVVPDSKYAQLTAEKTLIGMNHNSIFRIDPRLSGNKRIFSITSRRRQSVQNICHQESIFMCCNDWKRRVGCCIFQ